VRSEKAHYKNILIINFGQLGDVVVSAEIMRAVREQMAPAKVTLLVGTGAAEIARIANVADEYIAYDRSLISENRWLKGTASAIDLIRELRRRRFDLVIDLFSRYETNLLGFVAGIPNRLYAPRNTRSIDSLTNVEPAPPPFDPTRHITDRCFDLVSVLGVKRSSKPFRFLPPQTDIDRMAELNPGLRGAIGIFPGAGHDSRKWPLERFAGLAEHIIERGRIPAVFLGPDEDGITDRVREMFPPETIIVKGLDLSGLIAAMANLPAMVGNDTGTTHIAAQTGLAVVLIIDKRAPADYRPMSGNVKVVDTDIVSEITPQDVRAALDAILDEIETAK